MSMRKSCQNLRDQMVTENGNKIVIQDRKGMLNVDNMLKSGNEKRKKEK